MYYTYILKSSKYNKTYVGITSDVARRLNQHNSGYHSYTKRFLPWEILHKEEHKDRKEARTREKYLKSSAGRKWIKRTLFS